MKIRSFFSFVLCLICIFVVGSVSVSAANSGTCGDNLTWELDSQGTLTISGSGAMDDYSSYTMPWYSNISEIKRIVIGNEVTRIGDNAFYKCSALTRVNISISVTSIGERAFYNCTALTRVDITNVSVWCSIEFENEYANPVYYAKNLYLNNTLLKSVKTIKI